MAFFLQLLIPPPLNISAQNIVEFLLQAEAGVNVVDSQMCTPLHYACEKRLIQVAEELLKHR